MKTAPLVVVCFAVAILCIGWPCCWAADAISAGVAGRYTAKGEPPTYLDIRADGTFSFSQGPVVISGTFSIKGNELSLNRPGGPPETLQIAPGVLVRGDGEKVERTGDAMSAQAVSEAVAKAKAAGAVDRLAQVKSMGNMKQLCEACVHWAADHQGVFPDSIDQLLDAKYVGRDPAVFRCPLLNDDKQVGYLYLGKGVKTTDDGATILLISRWQGPDGQHIIGHADASVVVGVPKLVNFSASVRATMKLPGKAASGAPAAPVPPAASGTPVAAVAPNLAKITLTRNDNGKGRYGAIFPPEQMPANPEGYFWVTDRPDNKSNVTPLQHNTWFVSTLPGVYKVRVEYRVGKVKQQVSNLVELTVPNTGQ